MFAKLIVRQMLKRKFNLLDFNLLYKYFQVFKDFSCIIFQKGVV